MADILVRNLDPQVVERLKARAETNHRSLQAELKLILEEASLADRREALERLREMREKFRSEGRHFSDSTLLIREDRDSR